MSQNAGPTGAEKSPWATRMPSSSTPGDPSTVHGTPLLPDQHKSGDRYLADDSRDFIAVEQRASVTP